VRYEQTNFVSYKSNEDGDVGKVFEELVEKGLLP
jgi:hypothetical protein